MESESRRRLLHGAGVAGLVTLAGCSAAGAQRPSLVNAPSVTVPERRFGQVLRSPAQFDDTTGRQVGNEDDSEPTDGDTGTSETSEGSGSNRSLIAVTAVRTIQIFAEPNEDAEVTHELDNPTVTNGPLVFLTTQRSGDWLEVLLPVRPNGSTGWIHAADVQLAEHMYRIQVDLDDFRMRIFEDGQTIFDAVAGVASNNTPTPGGVYYVTELLAPPIPNSAYGAFAYGLSGFSEVFETFNGGPGQLGIHGTNDPDTLGTAVSAGCIRLHNDDIRRIAEFLPLGVPVTVKA